MKIEIKRWDNNKIIVCGEYESIKDCLEKNINKGLRFVNFSYADLRSANLSSVNLSSAKLSSADLSSANLSYADLRYADLRSAKLSYADLRYADLSSANLRFVNFSYADLRSAKLSSAKHINKYITTPLYILYDQVGKITAYKIVNENYEGIYNGGLVYKIGKMVEEKNANTDEQVPCTKGINLATLDWCINEWRKGYKILKCEFTAKDIACIPIGSDGKFRVFRCKVVGEKDLSEIGLTSKKGEGDERV